MNIRKLISFILLFVICLTLPGCSFDSSVDELFTLPQVPLEYSELSGELEKLIGSGYEYVNPESSTNVQSVQMVDYDKDGQQEVFVFLRKANESEPLKIFVYKKVDGNYQQFTIIESSASSIESVYYEDLNADNRMELIVGWKASGNLKNVVVYSIGRDVIKLMDTSYVRFSVTPLENDGIPAVLVISNSEAGAIAEYFAWNTNVFSQVYQVKLSSTISEIDSGSIVNGSLSSGNLANYITGVTENNMAKTDILVLQGDEMINVAKDASTGKTGAVYSYRKLIPQDINEDGFIEIPCPASVYGSGGTEIPSVDTMVSWRQYDVLGNVTKVEETYHCQSAGWYFTMPTAWWNRVVATTIEGGSGESEVSFAVDSMETMAIYTITGENRENRGMLGNRFIVKRQTNTVLAAEVFDGAAAQGMTEDQLRKSFHLVVSTWGATA